MARRLPPFESELYQDIELAFISDGPIPLEVADTYLCLVTGWTWQDLMSTPEEVVEQMRMLLVARGRADRHRRAVQEARAAAMARGEI